MISPAPFRRVESCVPKRYGRYRYLLEVRLAEGPGPRLLAVLKNPSTASDRRSDPTIGKVEAWARRRGFALVSVVNLFAWRSPYPRKLNGHPYAKIVGSGNDRHILAAAGAADLVVAGWGNSNGADPATYARRIEEVIRLIGPFRPHAVGPLTRAGQPRHALLWNGDVRAAPLEVNPPPAPPAALRR